MLAMPYPPDLSDEDLDREARQTSGMTQFGAGAYLDEINRRSVDRQTRQSIALTEEIRRLTDQIRWLTGAAILIAAISLLVAVTAIVRPL